MNEISLEKKYILEYIKDILNDTKLKIKDIDNAKYHHCTSYQDATSVLKMGILSMQEIKELGIKDYNQELLEIMKDTSSHINGIDTVSLSIAGLDDLYPNEDEFNPFSPENVDFLIDSNVKASRCSIHYGNEYLAKEKITQDKIKSVDIRLLNYINKIDTFSFYSTELAIKKYNCIKSIAQTLKQLKQEIPLREMSSESFTIDLDKASKLPKLSLK